MKHFKFVFQNPHFMIVIDIYRLGYDAIEICKRENFLLSPFVIFWSLAVNLLVVKKFLYWLRWPDKENSDGIRSKSWLLANWTIITLWTWNLTKFPLHVFQMMVNEKIYWKPDHALLSRLQSGSVHKKQKGNYDVSPGSLRTQTYFCFLVLSTSQAPPWE